MSETHDITTLPKTNFLKTYGPKIALSALALAALAAVVKAKQSGLSVDVSTNA